MESLPIYLHASPYNTHPCIYNATTWLVCDPLSFWPSALGQFKLAHTLPGIINIIVVVVIVTRHERKSLLSHGCGLFRASMYKWTELCCEK